MVILQGQIQTRIGGQILTPTAGEVLDVDRSAIQGNTTATGDSDELVLDIFMPPAPVARPPRGVPASARYRS